MKNIFEFGWNEVAGTRFGAILFLLVMLALMILSFYTHKFFTWLYAVSMIIAIPESIVFILAFMKIDIVVADKARKNLYARMTE